MHGTRGFWAQVAGKKCLGNPRPCWRTLQTDGMVMQIWDHTYASSSPFYMLMGRLFMQRSHHAARMCQLSFLCSSWRGSNSSKPKSDTARVHVRVISSNFSRFIYLVSDFLLGKCIYLGYGKSYGMPCPINASSCWFACRLGTWPCQRSSLWRFSWRRSTRWMVCHLQKNICTENVGESNLQLASSRGRVAGVRFRGNHGWISVMFKCLRVHVSFFGHIWMIVCESKHHPKTFK